MGAGLQIAAAFTLVVVIGASAFGVMREPQSLAPPGLEATESNFRMGIQEKISAAELNKLLKPILSLRPEDADSPVGRAVGQGLLLPDAETVLAQALPKEKVQRLLADSIEWLRTIVRPEWLAEPLEDQLFAVPKAIAGEDAFIGAWIKYDRPFQVAVTRERVHLVTRLPGSAARGGDQRPAARCLLFAAELLQLRKTPNLAEWQEQPFGGLLMIFRDVAFARNWDEAFMCLTDGVGAKYSALKYRNRTSEKERGSAVQEPLPWFVPPPHCRFTSLTAASGSCPAGRCLGDRGIATYGHEIS